MRKFLFSLFFIYFAHYVILLSKGKYNDSGQQSIHWHEHWSVNLSVAVNLSQNDECHDNKKTPTIYNLSVEKASLL